MPRKPKQRSRVTNGTSLFLDADFDGRTQSARRYADLIDIAEAERGGRDALSITQRQAVRAWAGLAVVLEQLHQDVASGRKLRPGDIEALGQIGDRMDRQARAMGKTKAVRAPTIHEHLAARRARGEKP